MIYRREEGRKYRNGINWNYVNYKDHQGFYKDGVHKPHHGGWWASLVLHIYLFGVGFRLGFRYRSWMRPRFINYSKLLNNNERYGHEKETTLPRR